MVRMQNNTTYIVAGLILFSLMGACAPTNPRLAISSNMDPALPALSYSWQTDMRRCWHRQLRFSKKRMLPASSASLIAPL